MYRSSKLSAVQGCDEEMVSPSRGAKRLQLHMLSCDPDLKAVGMFVLQLGRLRGVQQMSWVPQLLRHRHDHRMQVCLTFLDSAGSSDRREKQRSLLPKLALWA